MGIDLDNADGLRTTPGEDAKRRKTDRMLAAQDHGDCPAVDGRLYGFLYARQDRADFTSAINGRTGGNTGTERLGKAIPGLKLL